MGADLYLLAFGPLREAFSTRELHQWADTMAEREIRMRVGLDEVVGEWADNGSHGDRDGGAPWTRTATTRTFPTVRAAAPCCRTTKEK